MDKQTYGKMLASCIVTGSTICFPGTPSYGELQDFYKRFSRDLLGFNIPHYRVVGIWHDYDDKHGMSVFRTNDIFGMSCIELSMQARYIIPDKMGGNNGELGCFYGVSDDMSEYESFEDFKGFCRDWGMDNGKGIDNRTASVLNVSKDVVGSLMVDTSHDDMPQINEFTTSDLWYTQRMPYEVKFPKMLIPNKRIAGIQDTTLGKAPTFMFIMRGVGTMSYEESQELFNGRCSYIMPCNVRWDLSEFFVPRIPDPGDSCIYLTCFERLDEMVLQGILNKYGGELNEC